MTGRQGNLCQTPPKSAFIVTMEIKIKDKIALYLALAYGVILILLIIDCNIGLNQIRDLIFGVIELFGILLADIVLNK